MYNIPTSDLQQQIADMKRKIMLMEHEIGAREGITKYGFMYTDVARITLGNGQIVKCGDVIGCDTVQEAYALVKEIWPNREEMLYRVEPVYL